MLDDSTQQAGPSRRVTLPKAYERDVVESRSARFRSPFRWTIGRKLAALSMIGLLVAGVIGSISVTSVAKIQAASDLRSVLAAVGAELTRLDTLASDAQVYERDMLMAGNDAARTTAIGNLDATVRAAGEAWTRIDGLRLSQDLTQDLSEIRREHDGYMQVIIEMMPVLGSFAATSPEVAVALSREQERADAVRAQLKPIRDLLSARDKQAHRATDQRIADVRRAVLLAGLGGFGALLLVSVLLSRSITRRLRALRIRIAEIADGDGDLSARLSESALDETGDVARAANRFFARVQQLVEQLHRAEDELRVMAFHDNLTGLANRALFTTRLDTALGLARRHRDDLAVLLIDLDDFKPVNDGYGHEAGDIVLREVGKRLRAVVRETDTVARLGGDEFAIVLNNCTTEGAHTVAARIIASMSEPCKIIDQWARVGASVGVAFSRGQHDGDELLRHADTAMYASKARGKGSYAVFAEQG